MNRFALHQSQRLGLALVRGAGFQVQDLARCRLARGGEVLVKSYPTPQRIVRGLGRDKGARAAPDMQQAALGHIGKRAAYGVAVHAKARGQFSFGRQAVTGAIVTLGNLGRKGSGDGGPERAAGQGGLLS